MPEAKTELRVYIFLEIDRTVKKRLEFDTDEVTGREIKEKGGVPLQDDLAQRKGEQLELVTNDQVIRIHDGERFVALPPGTIS
jgi:hypothetical protein